MARFSPRYAASRRSVRLHLDGDGAAQSIEGILVGRWRGAYVLELARVVSAVGRSHALEGYVEVDAKRVAFMQVIPPAPAERPAPAALPWVATS
jgi:hypothetical protein